MRREGMISPTKAARMWDVHPHTVRKWCKDAVEGRKSKLPKGKVERNPFTGYYWIDLDEARTLKDRLAAEF